MAAPEERTTDPTKTIDGYIRLVKEQLGDLCDRKFEQHQQEWEKTQTLAEEALRNSEDALGKANAVLATLNAFGPRRGPVIETRMDRDSYGTGWWDACVYLKERFQRVGDQGHGNFEAFFNEANDAMNKGKRQ